MFTVDEALQLVERSCRPLTPHSLPLAEAAGLVLAEDVASDVDSPPHDKAMMDGYAVVSGDRSAERRVIEEIAAGAVPSRPVVTGTAARIMTGAPLPPGADAVVQVEKTELLDDRRVRLIQIDPAPGQNVLPLGASARAGDVVVKGGSVLRPIEIGILAEAGCPRPLVRPRPRVAILATGNELVGVDTRPAPGQIRNSNGPLLLAATDAMGADASDLGIASDCRDDLGDHIARGLAADVLLLSGGVSAGKFDLVPQVLAEQGVVQVFHKVAIRPGKPLWFGIRDTPNQVTLVFGLPGNPVSSFVCCELFVRPAIAALSGKGFLGLRPATAKLARAHSHSGGRVAYLPARYSRAEPERAATVEILPWHGSGDLAALASANALARMAETAELGPGDTVDVLII